MILLFVLFVFAAAKFSWEDDLLDDDYDFDDDDTKIMYMKEFPGVPVVVTGMGDDDTWDYDEDGTGDDDTKIPSKNQVKAKLKAGYKMAKTYYCAYKQSQYQFYHAKKVYHKARAWYYKNKTRYYLITGNWNKRFYTGGKLFCPEWDTKCYRIIKQWWYHRDRAKYCKKKTQKYWKKLKKYCLRKD